MLFLSGCGNKVVVKGEYIPPCQNVDYLENNSTWLDLLEKYLEIKDLYQICAKKVDIHNGKLEN